MEIFTPFAIPLVRLLSYIDIDYFSFNAKITEFVSLIYNRSMDKVKTVALVAHDNRKADLTEWVAYNADKLAKHHLVCTGTTGKLAVATLLKKGKSAQSLQKLKSGPLGGDQQAGCPGSRRQNRYPGFLLGSHVHATSRCGCESTA